MDAVVPLSAVLRCDNSHLASSTSDKSRQVTVKLLYPPSQQHGYGLCALKSSEWENRTSVQGAPRRSIGHETSLGLRCPGVDLLCPGYLTPTSSRQDHRLGSPWDRQRSATVLRCHLCGQKQPCSVTSAPPLVPLPVPFVRSVVIQSSSVEGEQGEETSGSSLGSWLRPCLVASPSAHQEKSHLTERENPHLEVRGSPAAS